MDKIEISEKRKTDLTKMSLLSDEMLKNKGCKVIFTIKYPSNYNGNRRLCDLYKTNQSKFVNVDKIIHYFCILCTGNDYIWEYSFENMEDLLKEREIFADYARIVEFNDEKILMIYEYK